LKLLIDVGKNLEEIEILYEKDEENYVTPTDLVTPEKIEKEYSFINKSSNSFTFVNQFYPRREELNPDLNPNHISFINEIQQFRGFYLQSTK